MSSTRRDAAWRTALFPQKCFHVAMKCGKCHAFDRISAGIMRHAP